MPKQDKIHRRTFEMDIRVGLDPKEREPITKELLAELEEMDKLRIEAKDTQAKYRLAIKERVDKAKELRVTLEQGHPEKHEVTEIKDFNKQKVTIKRTDNDHIVEVRDMTAEDHQLDLGGAQDPEED